MELVRISADESEKLWNMQKEAFADLLARYQDYDTNPAAEPLTVYRKGSLSPSPSGTSSELTEKTPEQYA